jgi:phosphate starvation-inducible membrane PsiE
MQGLRYTSSRQFIALCIAACDEAAQINSTQILSMWDKRYSVIDNIFWIIFGLYFGFISKIINLCIN